MRCIRSASSSVKFKVQVCRSNRITLQVARCLTISWKLAGSGSNRYSARRERWEKEEMVTATMRSSLTSLKGQHYQVHTCRPARLRCTVHLGRRARRFPTVRSPRTEISFQSIVFGADRKDDEDAPSILRENNTHREFFFFFTYTLAQYFSKLSYATRITFKRSG